MSRLNAFIERGSGDEGGGVALKNRENEKYVKIGVTGAAIAAFGILFFFLVYRADGLSGAAGVLMGILRPFLVGAVIAYLVTPLARWLGRLFGGKRPGLANALALILAILLVLAVLLLIVPQLVSSVVEVVKAAPAQFRALRASFEAWLDGMLEAHPEYTEQIAEFIGEMNTSIEGFSQKNFGSADDIVDKLMPIISGAAVNVGGAFGVMKDLFIGVIVALYFLSRRAQLAAQAKLMLRGAFRQEWADWIEREVRYADRMFDGFFMGKLLDSTIVGIICFIGCLVMRFESPLLIAVIVGVTNIIPFFGPFIGAIPSALLLLLENPMHALMFLIFVIILQQLDGNVIGPKILGDSTGLSALWVMFGILLFGGLWGITGMLVGVPLTAVLYDVVRQLTFAGVRRHGRDEMIEAYNAEFHPPVESKKK